ncbi:N-alpha-acetyltransferase 38, NatC auxiliary subunit-like [Crassostrea virginica]|uniref:N-alpha-acetyltransferase 38, NatC auxiliary subunit-like n=1 Tax=Crassostrea virginica TaxID=6565 RepID=A0A8B8EY09_CRAVI|nr:N-alpha-acetyltransferase 38, NatC auxiliary subunit-like [Crassostrea virginica]XP_022344822.1 N-alpha-acetyltransferase 38, NatC auxiliary subunit-like [Crassostrea virginica]
MAGEVVEKKDSDKNASEGRKKLSSWLNKSMKVQMTDGRTLIGVFLCTDRERNVILGGCEEYLKPLEGSEKEEPRILGLAMIPGHHIVSISIDKTQLQDSDVQ